MSKGVVLKVFVIAITAFFLGVWKPIGINLLITEDK